MNNEFLTLQETAQALGISKRSVQKAIQKQKLPYVYLYGKRLVTREAIKNYVPAKNGRPPKNTL